MSYMSDVTAACWNYCDLLDYVFFSSRRRHTRCALVTGSSDVCSSDLIHDPPTGLFRCHELEGPQHMRAQLRELPHHRYGRGGWLPGFDLVRDGPQRARVVPFDVIIERDQLFGIGNVGAANHILEIILP